MRITTINILLLLSIFINLIFGILIFSIKSQKNSAETWVIHTYNVIQKVTELESLIKDAETGQRGYLLTGKQAYLAPYYKALLSIGKELEEIEDLTKENITQQKNIRRLKENVNSKITELEKTINLFNAGNRHKAYELVNADHGKISMDSIREIISTILVIEDKLLAIRTDKLNHTQRLVNILIFWALIFIGIISVLALLSINKKQRENEALFVELESYNKNLELEVQKRTSELEESNNELIKINTEKNDFLGMAAHDLKNPLYNIKGLVYILEKQNDHLSNEQKRVVSHIAKAVNRMFKLVTDLLDINKIEQGNMQPVFEEIDIAELVEIIALSFKETALQKKINLQFESDFDSHFYKTDKSFLTQIVENLISNGLKYTQSGKNVYVRLLVNQNKVQIDVQDEGIGIKQEEQYLLFERFQKLSSKPTGGESSTGLGLSIVKHLVEKLGGTISFSSHPGIGSTFTIDL